MLTRLLGTVFLIVLIIGTISFANGWIKFQTVNDSTTIEMKSGEMKDAADKAIDKSKEFIDKAADKLNRRNGEDRNEKEEPSVD